MRPTRALSRVQLRVFTFVRHGAQGGGHGDLDHESIGMRDVAILLAVLLAAALWSSGGVGPSAQSHPPTPALRLAVPLLPAIDGEVAETGYRFDMTYHDIVRGLKFTFQLGHGGDPLEGVATLATLPEVQRDFSRQTRVHLEAWELEKLREHLRFVGFPQLTSGGVREQPKEYLAVAVIEEGHRHEIQYCLPPTQAHADLSRLLLFSKITPGRFYQELLSEL